MSEFRDPFPLFEVEAVADEGIRALRDLENGDSLARSYAKEIIGDLEHLKRQLTAVHDHVVAAEAIAALSKRIGVAAKAIQESDGPASQPSLEAATQAVREAVRGIQHQAGLRGDN